MNSSGKLIVGLGELLWDILPEGKQLGGAPANFAVMSGRLGNHAIIASRLGDDPLGKEAQLRLSGFPVDVSYMETDPEHETGTVSVEIVDGQPRYVFHQPVAWDLLEFTSAWRELAAKADAICFGTLAQRSAVSRQTIHDFLAASSAGCVRVFDVNLRKPFYDRAVIERSLERATILKLNDAEVPEVLSLLGLESDPRLVTDGEPNGEALLAATRRILAAFPLKLVCVTLGKYGSLLATREESARHPGVPVQVADTVGAGDAFTAAMVSAYLESAPLRVLNEAGNRWGAWVASQRGAMPPLPDSVRDSISAAIREAALRAV
jgi:fructokinase